MLIRLTISVVTNRVNVRENSLSHTQSNKGNSLNINLPYQQELRYDYQVCKALKYFQVAMSSTKTDLQVHHGNGGILVNYKKLDFSQHFVT